MKFESFKFHLGSPSDQDTIAAIATPPGRAGIGIIRISGSDSHAIGRRIFRPLRPVDDLKSHRLYLGRLIDPQSGETLDEVFLCCMKAPRSYTREDIVEINSHSGHFILSKILQVVMSQGARPARPGEFTFRAFMNGRIDLTQAEAVVDIIRAGSERGLHLAARQIKGRLGREVEELRQKGVEVLARLEAAIDFPEEEAEILDRGEAAEQMEQDIITPIESILSAHCQRRVWIEGVQTVIVGRVNAGKSSLLNRLLDEERAIVTPFPGTTRDIVESMLHIRGIPLRLMDTAGFRKVRGEAERMGILRAEEKTAEADLVLVVIDQSRPLNEFDHRLLSISKKETSLVVLNKSDLRTGLGGRSDQALGGFRTVRTSALKGQGIEEVKEAIYDLIVAGGVDTSCEIAPNIRHKEALSRAAGYYRDSVNRLREGMPLEIVALELREGLNALGEITGETTTEEILNRIFSEFCIGK